MTRRLALLGAVVGSAAAIVALHRLGSGPLAAPPVHSWAAVSRWYAEATPHVALIALLRCVGLLLAGWLFVASALQLLGAVPLLDPVGRLADHISPRSLQRLGHGLAGLSLTAGLAAVVPGAGIPLVAGGRSTLVVAQDEDPSTNEPGTATLQLVDDIAPEPGPELGDEVTVAVGDSFWSIAADVLTERVGAPPTDRQVVPYWRRLIEENREKLVDPANADLIFPGQVFTMPPS